MPSAEPLGYQALSPRAAAWQGDELAPRMRDALMKGELGISALSPRVTTGKEQWQDWHHDFAVNQMAGAIEDDVATRELSAAMDHEYETVNLDPNWTALHVRALLGSMFRF